MENITNQVLKLKNGKNFFILRQATYKSITYFLVAELTDDAKDFTNKFMFLEKKEVDGKFIVNEVVDNDILEVLSKNIKLD